MNAILIARYPGHQAGAVTDIFISPEFPPRHPSVQELGSINYMGADGYVTAFLVSIPDADLAAAVTAQAKRTAFMVSRVEGLTIQLHLGQDTSTAVPVLMEVRPR